MFQSGGPAADAGRLVRGQKDLTGAPVRLANACADVPDKHEAARMHMSEHDFCAAWHPVFAGRERRAHELVTRVEVARLDEARSDRLGGPDRLDVRGVDQLVFHARLAIEEA